MKLSVGRIVHFRNPDPEEKNEGLERLCNGGKCIAAIVVGVDPVSGEATLSVCWPWNNTSMVPGGYGYHCPSFHDVPEGLEPGQWHWPERVE
jgi:hypothetical protein